MVYLKILNNYYQKHKERLRKEARERCQNLSGKEKEKRHQYYLERKKKLPDYIRNYYLTQKIWSFLKDPRTIRLVSRICPGSIKKKL